MNRWVVSVHGEMGWGSPHFVFWGEEVDSVGDLRLVDQIDDLTRDITMAMRWAEGYRVEPYDG